MPLFVIEIPGSDFTGARGGVDFFRGKGTTSSRADAQRLAGLGCSVSELGITKGTVGEGAAAPSPAVFTPAPDELAAAAVAQEAAARAQELLERDPESAWSKRRAEQAAKAKKRPAGRRHR